MFIDRRMLTAGSSMELAGGQLRKLIDRQQELGATQKNQRKQFSQDPPEPILPSVVGSVLTLDMVDPVELARQLSLIEHELFQAIKPWECLGQAWTKKATRDQKAPHIMAMIQRFNQVPWHRSFRHFPTLFMCCKLISYHYQSQ